MDLTIENFRGIKHAHIKLSDKITLIGGLNGAGKTSVIQALRALVTGEAIPLPGLKKKDAKDLVHGEKKSGSATLSWSNGNVGITWPGCKVLSGSSFKCSAYAAGLLLPAMIPAKDLTSILNILPTWEDFKSEWAIPEGVNITAEQVWESIEKLGWDGAHNHATTKGRDLKRDWEKFAGENWGSDKALKWQPENYTDKTPEELETALKTAEKLYEHAVKSVALNDKEQEDLQKLADQYDDVQKSINGFNSDISTVNADLNKAQALLQEIPRIINQQQAYECWSCGKLGVIQNGKLTEAPDPNKAQEDVAAAQQRIAEQNQIIRDLQAKRDSIQVSLRVAQTQLAKCEDAKRQVQEVVLDAPQPVLSVDDARAEIELCRKRITAHKIKIECDELREMLGINGYICDVLNPDGLRKQVLSAKLASFNELLSIVCENAEWPVIALDECLDIRFNGRPYVLLSEGEKFVVNAALQLALVKLDGSQIIILDGIDILDRRYLNGLINVLSNIPIPSVIGCKFNSNSDVPDLGDTGLAYWCEDGRVNICLNKT